MPREFDISDVLTVTTGRLVSTRHVEGVYDILGYMSGEALFTHQLPRVLREAKPILLAQHPQLAGVDATKVTPENVAEHVAGWRAEFGDTLPVSPMNEDQHERIDPVSELAEKVHPSRIVVVGP